MAYKSQNNEVEVVMNYFGVCVGNLLDIGANDGVTFSNSFDLISKGWGGVLVEPHEPAYERILARYYDNRNVQPFHGGISTTTGRQIFYTPEDSLLASLLPNIVKKRTREVSEPFYSFHDFMYLSKIKQFDFISIDAEGSDWDILQQMDLTALGCKCICIEHSGNFDNIIHLCSEHGLTTELLRNGENIIIAK